MEQRKQCIIRGNLLKELYRKESDNYAIKNAVRLIANSRKDIATITNITYLPVSSDDVAKTNNGDCDLEIQKIQPKFKIQYRFNPPDDRRQEDIVHEYITHVEPENRVSGK